MALPSPLEAFGKSKSVNFNSLLQIIGLCSLWFVYDTVHSTSNRLTKIDEQLAVMSSTSTSKWEQLDRIESEVSKQRDQLHDLQLELAKLKSK